MSNRISILVSFESSSGKLETKVFVGKFFSFTAHFFFQDWLADKHLDESIIDRSKFWREKRLSVRRKDCLVFKIEMRVVSFYYSWQKEKEKYVVFLHEVYEVASGLDMRFVWFMVGVSRIIEFLSVEMNERLIFWSLINYSESYQNSLRFD